MLPGEKETKLLPPKLKAVADSNDLRECQSTLAEVNEQGRLSTVTSSRLRKAEPRRIQEFIEESDEPRQSSPRKGRGSIRPAD